MTLHPDKPSQEALKLAEQWKGRADDAGRLARAVINESVLSSIAASNLPVPKGRESDAEWIGDRNALLDFIEEAGRLFNVPHEPWDGRAKRILAALIAARSAIAPNTEQLKAKRDAADRAYCIAANSGFPADKRIEHEEEVERLRQELIAADEALRRADDTGVKP